MSAKKDVFHRIFIGVFVFSICLFFAATLPVFVHAQEGGINICSIPKKDAKGNVIPNQFEYEGKPCEGTGTCKGGKCAIDEATAEEKKKMEDAQKQQNGGASSGNSSDSNSVRSPEQIAKDLESTQKEILTADPETRSALDAQVNELQQLQKIDNEQAQVEERLKELSSDPNSADYKEAQEQKAALDARERQINAALNGDVKALQPDAAASANGPQAPSAAEPPSNGSTFKNPDQPSYVPNTWDKVVEGVGAAYENVKDVLGNLTEKATENLSNFLASFDGSATTDPALAERTQMAAFLQVKDGVGTLAEAAAQIDTADAVSMSAEALTDANKELQKAEDALKNAAPAQRAALQAQYDEALQVANTAREEYASAVREADLLNAADRNERNALYSGIQNAELQPGVQDDKAALAEATKLREAAERAYADLSPDTVTDRARAEANIANLREAERVLAERVQTAVENADARIIYELGPDGVQMQVVTPTAEGAQQLQGEIAPLQAQDAVIQQMTDGNEKALDAIAQAEAQKLADSQATDQFKNNADRYQAQYEAQDAKLREERNAVGDKILALEQAQVAHENSPNKPDLFTRIFGGLTEESRAAYAKWLDEGQSISSDLHAANERFSELSKQSGRIELQQEGFARLSQIDPQAAEEVARLVTQGDIARSSLAAAALEQLGQKELAMTETLASMDQNNLNRLSNLSGLSPEALENAEAKLILDNSARQASEYLVNKQDAEKAADVLRQLGGSYEMTDQVRQTLANLERDIPRAGQSFAERQLENAAQTWQKDGALSGVGAYAQAASNIVANRLSEITSASSQAFSDSWRSTGERLAEGFSSLSYGLANGMYESALRSASNILGNSVLTGDMMKTIALSGDATSFSRQLGDALNVAPFAVSPIAKGFEAISSIGQFSSDLGAARIVLSSEIATDVGALARASGEFELAQGAAFEARATGANLAETSVALARAQEAEVAALSRLEASGVKTVDLPNNGGQALMSGEDVLATRGLPGEAWKISDPVLESYPKLGVDAAPELPLAEKITRQEANALKELDTSTENLRNLQSETGTNLSAAQERELARAEARVAAAENAFRDAGLAKDDFGRVLNSDREVVAREAPYKTSEKLGGNYETVPLEPVDSKPVAVKTTINGEPVTIEVRPETTTGAPLLKDSKPSFQSGLTSAQRSALEEYSAARAAYEDANTARAINREAFVSADAELAKAEANLQRNGISIPRDSSPVALDTPRPLSAANEQLVRSLPEAEQSAARATARDYERLVAEKNALPEAERTFADSRVFENRQQGILDRLAKNGLTADGVTNEVRAMTQAEKTAYQAASDARALAAKDAAEVKTNARDTVAAKSQDRSGGSLRSVFNDALGSGNTVLNDMRIIGDNIATNIRGTFSNIGSVLTNPRSLVQGPVLASQLFTGASDLGGFVRNVASDVFRAAPITRDAGQLAGNTARTAAEISVARAAPTIMDVAKFVQGVELATIRELSQTGALAIRPLEGFLNLGVGEIRLPESPVLAVQAPAAVPVLPAATANILTPAAQAAVTTFQDSIRQPYVMTSPEVTKALDAAGLRTVSSDRLTGAGQTAPADAARTFYVFNDQTGKVVAAFDHVRAVDNTSALVTARADTASLKISQQPGGVYTLGKSDLASAEILSPGSQQVSGQSGTQIANKNTQLTAAQTLTDAIQLESASNFSFSWSDLNPFSSSEAFANYARGAPSPDTLTAVAENAHKIFLKNGFTEADFKNAIANPQAHIALQRASMQALKDAGLLMPAMADGRLVAAVEFGKLMNESGAPSRARCSGAGACGAYQLMVGTAEDLGVPQANEDGRVHQGYNLIASVFSLNENIRVAARDPKLTTAQQIRAALSKYLFGQNSSVTKSTYATNALVSADAVIKVMDALAAGKVVSDKEIIKINPKQIDAGVVDEWRGLITAAANNKGLTSTGRVFASNEIVQTPTVIPASAPATQAAPSPQATAPVAATEISPAAKVRDSVAQGIAKLDAQVKATSKGAQYVVPPTVSGTAQKPVLANVLTKADQPNVFQLVDAKGILLGTFDPVSTAKPDSVQLVFKDAKGNTDPKAVTFSVPTQGGELALVTPVSAPVAASKPAIDLKSRVITQFGSQTGAVEKEAITTGPIVSTPEAEAKAAQIVQNAKQANAAITEAQIGAQLVVSGMDFTKEFETHRLAVAKSLAGSTKQAAINKAYTAANIEIAKETAAILKANPSQRITSYSKRFTQITPESVVEDYLWSAYQRAPLKIDTGGDYTWKDITGALNARKSLRDYVIGGLNMQLKTNLYAAGKAMDAAGVQWSFLAGYRGLERPAATGKVVAKPENSQHYAGGYGRGNAVDLGGAKGVNNQKIWDWLADHGDDYGLKNHFIDNDPAHVIPAGDQEILAAQKVALANDVAKIAANSKLAAAPVEAKPASAPLVTQATVPPPVSVVSAVQPSRGEPAAAPGTPAQSTASTALVAPTAVAATAKAPLKFWTSLVGHPPASVLSDFASGGIVDSDFDDTFNFPKGVSPQITVTQYIVAGPYKDSKRRQSVSRFEKAGVVTKSYPGWPDQKRIDFSNANSFTNWIPLLKQDMTEAILAANAVGIKKLSFHVDDVSDLNTDENAARYAQVLLLPGKIAEELRSSGKIASDMSVQSAVKNNVHATSILLGSGQITPAEISHIIVENSYYEVVARREAGAIGVKYGVPVVLKDFEVDSEKRTTSVEQARQLASESGIAFVSLSKKESRYDNGIGIIGTPVALLANVRTVSSNSSVASAPVQSPQAQLPVVQPASAPVSPPLSGLASYQSPKVLLGSVTLGARVQFLQIQKMVTDANALVRASEAERIRLAGLTNQSTGRQAAQAAQAARELTTLKIEAEKRFAEAERIRLAALIDQSAAETKAREAEAKVAAYGSTIQKIEVDNAIAQQGLASEQLAQAEKQMADAEQKLAQAKADEATSAANERKAELEIAQAAKPQEAALLMAASGLQKASTELDGAKSALNDAKSTRDIMAAIAKDAAKNTEDVQALVVQAKQDVASAQSALASAQSEAEKAQDALKNFKTVTLVTPDSAKAAADNLNKTRARVEQAANQFIAAINKGKVTDNLEAIRSSYYNLLNTSAQTEAAYAKAKLAQAYSDTDLKKIKSAFDQVTNLVGTMEEKGIRGYLVWLNASTIQSYWSDISGYVRKGQGAVSALDGAFRDAKIKQIELSVADTSAAQKQAEDAARAAQDKLVDANAQMNAAQENLTRKTEWAQSAAKELSLAQKQEKQSADAVVTANANLQKAQEAYTFASLSYQVANSVSEFNRLAETGQTQVAQTQTPAETTVVQTETQVVGENVLPTVTPASAPSSPVRPSGSLLYTNPVSNWFEGLFGSSNTSAGAGAGAGGASAISNTYESLLNSQIMATAAQDSGPWIPYVWVATLQTVQRPDSGDEALAEREADPAENLIANPLAINVRGIIVAKQLEDLPVEIAAVDQSGDAGSSAVTTPANTTQVAQTTPTPAGTWTSGSSAVVPPPADTAAAPASGETKDAGGGATGAGTESTADATSDGAKSSDTATKDMGTTAGNTKPSGDGKVSSGGNGSGATQSGARDGSGQGTQSGPGSSSGGSGLGSIFGMLSNILRVLAAFMGMQSATPPTQTQCPDAPQQPATTTCPRGVWKPISTHMDGCTSGWQCIPVFATSTPVATTTIKQIQQQPAINYLQY